MQVITSKIINNQLIQKNTNGLDIVNLQKHFFRCIFANSF